MKSRSLKNIREGALILLIVAMVAVGHISSAMSFTAGTYRSGRHGAGSLGIFTDPPQGFSGWPDIFFIVVIAGATIYSWLIYFQVVYPMCPFQYLRIWLMRK